MISRENFRPHVEQVGWNGMEQSESRFLQKVTAMPRKPTTTTAEPTIGHNSLDRDKLRGIVERIESIEAERAVRAAPPSQFDSP